jgi:Flp pilus assembly pilin Flp
MRVPNNKKRGAALVEYGLLVAGVALVTAAAVSIFGHKVNDLMGTSAAILPSTDVEDTGPITGGHLIQTTNVDGSIEIDPTAATDGTTMDQTFGIDADLLIDDTIHESGG